MTGYFPLDWATQAVSLFNAILLFWLGLTVLLNAERRSLGLWVAGGQLLMGAAFFLSHSIILGYGQAIFNPGVNFWWRLGWIPVISLPYAWYGVMLWYAGYWSEPSEPGEPSEPISKLRRHRLWFAIDSSLAAFIIGLLIFANPLPSFNQLAQLKLNATLSIGGIPVLILIYPLYIALCIGLSLDVLRHPAPSGRLMGDLARRRARPWLLAATFVQLVVSALVGLVMLWVILSAGRRVFDHPMAVTVALFDLVIASLIAVAILMVGQAIVSYEVFTGKPLPRGGLQRYWQRLLILAAGYCAAVSASLALPLKPIYSLLLSTTLMIAFYALLTWRSYAERQSFVDRLRPFVASQRLYDQMTAPSRVASPELDAYPPFDALCGDVLGARRAYLIPLGALAALAGPPLVYPRTQDVLPPALGEITSEWTSPQTLCTPLDSGRYPGVAWGIPLWSERGLVGALLLGEKQDGSLYTQEDFEIARAVCERLVDSQASVEMAQRLMSLQRQRLAESQVLDRQTRRLLHDDVLPRLHAVMLALSEGKSTLQTTDQSIQALGELHHQISDLLRELPAAPAPEVARLGLIGALRNLLDGELRGAFDQVDWHIPPETEAHLREVPRFKAEVLFYAAREVLRNAARHAGEAHLQVRPDTHRETPLHLSIRARWQDGLELSIEDNGGGIKASVGNAAGSGQGLTLHSTLMAVVGGSLVVESTPGVSTRVLLRLPNG
jgi:signal transduction histidine kinase